MNTQNLNKFTQRESIILAELLKGKTNQEISETFFITLHTVKAHIASILHKTHSKHRAQLISKVFSNLLKIDLNTTAINQIIEHLTPNL